MAGEETNTTETTPQRARRKQASKIAASRKGVAKRASKKRADGDAPRRRTTQRRSLASINPGDLFPLNGNLFQVTAISANGALEARLLEKDEVKRLKKLIS
jgi:hypothetical protein